MNENKVKKSIKKILDLLYSRGILNYQTKQKIWNDYKKWQKDTIGKKDF